MFNSQGSAKELFTRGNNQMDAFGLSLSQDWNNSLSQGSKTFSCTPSNIHGFSGHSESMAQQTVPNTFNQNLFGTPINKSRDLIENQLSRKIWYGLTAVFKIVSDLPEKLKVGHNDSLQGSKRDMESVADDLRQLFKTKSEEFKPLLIDVQNHKEQRSENKEQFQKVYELLELLNSKINECQDLFEILQTNYQDISEQNGILLQKLSMKIKDIKTWIADFLNVQNYDLLEKYDNLKEMLIVLKNDGAELNKKFESGFDQLTSQLLEVKMMVENIRFNKNQNEHGIDTGHSWHLKNTLNKTQEIVKTSPFARVLPLLTKRQTAVKNKILNQPNKEIIKQSPVAHVLPSFRKREDVAENRIINQPRKRSLDVLFYGDHMVNEKKVKHDWYERTPNWIACGTRSYPVERRNTSSVMPSNFKRNELISQIDTSYGDVEISMEDIEKNKEILKNDKVFQISRPLSRLSSHTRIGFSKY